MPTPPIPPATPSSKTAAPTAPAAASGVTKPRSTAKKTAAKASAGEGTLIDKSLQKTTTRKAAAKPKAVEKSTFEKPAEADWHRMISETAYYRAERRGFAAGYEHEDWVWAEEEVRKILSP